MHRVFICMVLCLGPGQFYLLPTFGVTGCLHRHGTWLLYPDDGGIRFLQKVHT